MHEYESAAGVKGKLRCSCAGIRTAVQVTQNGLSDCKVTLTKENVSEGIQ